VQASFDFVCPDMAHHARFTPRAVELIAGFRLFHALRANRVRNPSIIRSNLQLILSYPWVDYGN
jgi:hypothetical protein